MSRAVVQIHSQLWFTVRELGEFQEIRIHHIHLHRKCVMVVACDPIRGIYCGFGRRYNSMVNS